MGVEILGADVKPEQVKVSEEDDTFLPEMESKTKSEPGPVPEEATKVGLTDSSNGVNGEKKEADHQANANFPKDAADEWPAPKQIHSFYFVRFRTYDDPQLKVKIEQADKEIQRKNQARFQITEALKAKRSERSNVISQLKPLTTEDKKYRMVMDEKRKEMEPLQAALGKLRTVNNTAREKGMGLCASEEELNDLIHSLHYRIQHESNTLVEEKQLLKDIKQLEGTRDKVIANAAMKAKIQGSLGQKEAIQGQVKLIGGDLDGVRKEKQAIRTQIKQLEEELKAIDDEISSLQEELTAITEKREKAYEALNALRKVREEVNTCFYQNRALLNNAKELAARKDVAGLEGLCHSEVEKFMSQWSSSKAFRDDYEKRILSSLDARQLSRDGRMRNPDEKPIIVEAPVAPKSEATKLEATPIKAIARQAKEDVKPPSRHDTVSTHKLQADVVVTPTEEDKGGKSNNQEDIGNADEIKKSHKESAKSKEIDAAKLKEMKREEEIAKAKLAMERKKKLAEKAAVKAAARAQKEAEKKLKEKEKRAKKKAGATEPVTPAEETETETNVAEPEEAELKSDTTVSEKSKEQKEKVRYRNRQKAQDQLPKVILKRKKSHSYGSWAIPAAILALVLVIVGVGYYSFGGN